MTDLRDAILAALDAKHEDAYWLYRATVETLLDLHAAPDRALPGEIHCGELIDWVQGGCPTVRVIAEKLGVEVSQP